MREIPQMSRQDALRKSRNHNRRNCSLHSQKVSRRLQIPPLWRSLIASAMVKRDYLVPQRRVVPPAKQSKTLSRVSNSLVAAGLADDLAGARALTGAPPPRRFIGIAAGLEHQTFSSGRLPRILGAHGHSRASEAGPSSRPSGFAARYPSKSLRREAPRTVHSRLKQPEEVLAAVGSMSKLETNAVKAGTLSNYIEALQGLSTWLEAEGIRVEEYDSEKFEQVLLEWADCQFNDGKPPEMGTTLCAAVKALYPRYSKSGDLKLPRFSRALAGWSKLMPGESRWPVPWPLVAAAAVWLARRKKTQEALALVLSFSGYLRPGEMMTLRVMDLVAPPAYDDGRGHWSLLIRPAGRGRSTKTGTFDDSIILDSEYTSSFSPLWRALTEGRVGTDPLFRFKQEAYSRLVKEAFVAVGGAALAPVAYSCRHGGPAWDRYRKFRTVQEVKSRGRWLSDRSLRRYEKHSKMAQAMCRIGRKWQRFHAECAAHLAAILSGRRAPPVAP